LLEKYRIKRINSRNIVIQRKVGKEWRTASYHGNSLNSLISGILGLITSKCIPEDEKLSDALSSLELELVSSMDKVEKWIKEQCKEL
jgi:hypothetical protein